MKKKGPGMEIKVINESIKRLALPCFVLFTLACSATAAVCTEMVTNPDGLSRCIAEADTTGDYTIQIPPSPDGLRTNTVLLKGSGVLKRYTIVGTGAKIVCNGPCFSGDSTGGGVIPTVIFNNLWFEVRGEGEQHGVELLGNAYQWVFRDVIFFRQKKGTGIGFLAMKANSCSCHHVFAGATAFLNFRTGMWLSGDANGLEISSLKLFATETGFRCEAYPGSGDTRGGHRHKIMGLETVGGKVGWLLGSGCSGNVIVGPWGEYAETELWVRDGAQGNVFVGGVFGPRKVVIEPRAMRENRWFGTQIDPVDPWWRGSLQIRGGDDQAPLHP